MKLCEYKEIKVLYNEEDVNKVLKKGFYLIKILQSKKNDDELMPCFILGKLGF